MLKKQLGKKDIETLQGISKEIKRLASLKNASFHCNSDQDEKIKSTILPYMSWIETCALDIENVINGNDTIKRFY